jgi:hypothetical protein
MCEYKTRSHGSECAAFADAFQVEEWTAIFIGDMATDVLVVCFAFVEIWPLQMKTRLRVKAIFIFAIRLL